MQRVENGRLKVIFGSKFGGHVMPKMVRMHAFNTFKGKSLTYGSFLVHSNTTTCLKL